MIEADGRAVHKLRSGDVLQFAEASLEYEYLAKPGVTAPRAAEFFAGIGLVRMGLEQAGFEVVFANDIDKDKLHLYEANFGPLHIVPGDIRGLNGADIPDVEVATASFPCTDLSLAGNRAGLSGDASGMFWHFVRVLDEMGARRPAAILIENVVGFGSSRSGDDLRVAIEQLNSLGYWCDIFVADARHFIPQSRPRMFLVGSQAPVGEPGNWQPSQLRPAWISRFVSRNPDLMLHATPLSLPDRNTGTLSDVVERLPPDHPRWWTPDRLERFLSSLSPIQARRLELRQSARSVSWATAYRRTRHSKPVWEIRADAISGCLRTARGGSSKQALVETGRGDTRVRWMTPREYARLQGAGSLELDSVSENKALFALGDAVCVPVIGWIAENCLMPLVEQRRTAQSEQVRSFA
ncbi:MAG: DNA (cytosine-5-)-methyltransferase [Dehalococcoidia bacterium]